MLYDHKDLFNKGDKGTARISDFASLDNIKGYALDRGYIAITLAGDTINFKDFPRTPDIGEFNECSGCQTWVYSPMF